MKITFLGATYEVTGSCYLLEVDKYKILVDFGMFQGEDKNLKNELPIMASEIDFVLLTHAHIDHSGRLPLLAKSGFNGKVYTTHSTDNLCQIMLLDSAHIQEMEYQWHERKAKRAGKVAKPPLYTIKDAQEILKSFVGCDYNEIITINECLQIRFIDVGHLLGSSSIEVWLSEDGIAKKIVFSGDIGNLNQPLIKDPSYITDSDYVVTESTYGDRNHEISLDYAKSLSEIIERTFRRGGNVVIPSFAIGRTQEVLYFIRQIKERKLIPSVGDFPVYVDSPLANEATEIYLKDEGYCFDAEAMDLVNRGINPLGFSNLHRSISTEDSRAINDLKTSCVIISASGMCEAGRIKHHLKHNLWRKESTVVFVGFQARNTLGRRLMDGEKQVKIFGDEIYVQAEIVKLDGVSAHADRNGLLDWLKAFKNIISKVVFVTHGANEVCDNYGRLVEEKLNYKAIVPYYKGCYDLKNNELIDIGNKDLGVNE